RVGLKTPAWGADAPSVIRIRPFLSTLLLVLAVAAPAQAQSTAERTITVEGDASRRVPNDTARFSTNVSLERRTAGAALAANARVTRRVLSRLSALGIKRADTRTTGVTLRKVFERNRRTRRLVQVGYQARNSVRVTVRELSLDRKST